MQVRYQLRQRPVTEDDTTRHRQPGRNSDPTRRSLQLLRSVRPAPVRSMVT